MKGAIFALAGLALSATAAQATLFSFASDHDHTSFTFRGLGNAVTGDVPNPQVLQIDDDNGAQPFLNFNVDFRTDFNIQWVTDVPQGASLLHVYNIINGIAGVPTFTFVDSGGNDLLRATFTGGTLTSSGGPADWGSAGNIQAVDIAGEVTYTWLGPDLPLYGLFHNQSSVGVDDAAFTLSDLSSQAGAGVPLDGDHFPRLPWASEGSFSGTGHFVVPAPGSLALMGLTGLITARRRRS